MNESKRLIEYVTKRHEIKPVDETCQFKGGEGEKFCRATSQKTCEGCRFYRMAIWQVFNRAYDLLTAKDKQIKQMRRQKEEKLEFGKTADSVCGAVDAY